MVSKNHKKTPTRAMKDRRNHHHHHHRQRKRSPAKLVSSSAILSSIEKTIFSCKRKLIKIFSRFACLGTPTSRHKGYKALKKGFRCYQDQDSPNRLGGGRELIERSDSICRVLFYNEKLPPLISPAKKKTVFLDLDETLVHSKADPPPKVFDFVVRPKIDGEIMNFYVLKRPGVDEFLEALARKYELVVFTAGLKEYASLVLDNLDKNEAISHRLYRDSCKQVDGKFVKDLSEMGRDLRNVVIVDDNPNCYIFQPDNAIPVKPFIDDVCDGELGKLARFFEECDCFDDMRDAVKLYVS